MTSIACCTGTKDTGTPKGTLERVGTLECYIARPPHDTATAPPPTKAIIFCTDLFGHSWINNQLTADKLAKGGYLVVVPDLFNGDPYDHSPTTQLPLLTNLITTLKTTHTISKFAATGYCYGAKPAMMLAAHQPTLINAVGIYHPSFMSTADFEGCKVPIYVGHAGNDHTFSRAQRIKAEKTLKENKQVTAYEVVDYEGMEHGFAVRGDLKDPKVREARERVTSETQRFFDLHL
ncbi:hypothetical protein HK104_008729 [Borealophlyctis nickersoniae]|nr:hypothetical protein HK104_008729 [Borealophlyctis nickersoniae]